MKALPPEVDITIISPAKIRRLRHSNVIHVTSVGHFMTGDRGRI